MQWVINYYKHGIPDWTWQYMFNYGPFLDDLTREMKTYKFNNFELHEPVTSFEQLLGVLPPKSKREIRYNNGSWQVYYKSKGWINKSN